MQKRRSCAKAREGVFFDNLLVKGRKVAVAVRDQSVSVSDKQLIKSRINPPEGLSSPGSGEAASGIGE